MKEQYLIRGQGFCGNKLQSLSEGLLLERDWTHVPLVEHIIYTAGYGNYYDQKDVFDTYKANVTEALRLMKFTDKSFVYISSSSVLLPIQTPYSLSKKAMEEIISISDLPVCAVRPSSITGIGEQDKHLIPTLIRSCLEGERMPFVEEPTHDYIDIEDFCKGVLYISENIKEFRNKTLNLSSGINYSNLDVLNMVEEITGNKANIFKVDNMRKYDTKNWIVKPDLKFAEKPLYQSIQEMVYEYRKNH